MQILYNHAIDVNNMIHHKHHRYFVKIFPESDNIPNAYKI